MSWMSCCSCYLTVLFSSKVGWFPCAALPLCICWRVLVVEVCSPIRWSLLISLNKAKFTLSVSFHKVIFREEVTWHPWHVMLIPVIDWLTCHASFKSHIRISNFLVSFSDKPSFFFFSLLICLFLRNYLKNTALLLVGKESIFCVKGNLPCFICN